jgi:hypothetical protein
LNLNYLNDYSSEYVYDTLLPSSYNLGTTNSSINSSSSKASVDKRIILIASVMDSLGGVTNLTLPVKVIKVSDKILSD